MNQPPSMGIEHMLIIWHQTNDIGPMRAVFRQCHTCTVHVMYLDLNANYVSKWQHCRNGVHVADNAIDQDDKTKSVVQS